MFLINEMSLITGLQLLNMEQQKIFIDIAKKYKLIYPSLKKAISSLSPLAANEIVLPSQAEWEKKIDEYVQNWIKEIDEYQKKSIDLIQKFKFTLSYTFYTNLRKKYATYNIEEFLLPPDFRNLIVKINAEIPNDDRLKTAINYIFSIESQHSNYYKEFITRLMTGVFYNIIRYFTDELKKAKITIPQNGDVSKIYSDLCQKLQGSLLVEFKLMYSCNPAFLVYVIKDPYLEEYKSSAAKVDKSIEQHSGIKRLSYLYQQLDPMLEFTNGYCDLDASHWLDSLKEDVEISATKTINPNQLTHEEINLDIPRQQFKQSLMGMEREKRQKLVCGPHIFVYSSTEPNTDQLIGICESLSKHLKIVFNQKRKSHITIVIGTFVAKEGHALSLFKLSNKRGYLFRDVNQGVFWAQNLKSFIHWLPNFVQIMGYSDLFRSCTLRYLQEELIPVESNTYYGLARNTLDTLESRMLKTDRLKTLLSMKPSLEERSSVLGNALQFSLKIEDLGIKMLGIPSVALDAFLSSPFSSLTDIVESVSKQAEALYSNESDNVTQNNQVDKKSTKEVDYEECDDELDIDVWLPYLEQIRPEEAERLAMLEKMLELYSSAGTTKPEGISGISVPIMTQMSNLLLQHTNILHPFTRTANAELTQILQTKEPDERVLLGKLGGWYMLKLPLIFAVEARTAQHRISFAICFNKAESHFENCEAVKNLLFSFDWQANPSRIILEYCGYGIKP